MSGFTKLVPEIIQSSIWNESAEVRCVWITMLATKDANGYVRGDAKTIARLANVELRHAEEALTKFQQPDPSSHTPDNDGIRIEAAPGGWVVLNHELYRQRDHNEEHAEYMRNWRKNRDVKKCDSQVIHPSASVSVSVSVPEGESEGVPVPAEKASVVAGMVAAALKAYKLDPLMPAACRVMQTLRANCAELVLMGVTLEDVRYVVSWATHQSAQFTPKDPQSATDPAKFAKWRQMADEQSREQTNRKERR